MPHLSFSLPFFSRVKTTNSTPPGTQATEKSVVITEETLNNLLNANTNDYIKKPQAKISPEGIIVTGSAKKFLNIGLEMKATPYVENEKIKCKVTSARFGFLTPPKFLFSKISDLISAQLNNNLAQGLKISSIELSDKKITIKGK